MGENVLRIGHSILGIHAAVGRAVQEDLFYATYANISMFDTRIGELSINKVPIQLPAYNKSIESVRPINPTVRADIESGPISCRELEIHWEGSRTKLPS